MKAVLSSLVILTQCGPLAFASARAAPQPLPQDLPADAPPFSAPTPSLDGTFVTVSNWQVNWGNAYPWDILSFLNLPGGPCRKNATCDVKRELKLPTTMIDLGKKWYKVKKPREEQILVKITDSWWNNVYTRDAMVSSIITTAQKYNKVEDIGYPDLKHPAKNKPSMAQNLNTNNFLAESRDGEGETQGKLNIVIYASTWSSAGWCDDITKRANFTQGQDIALADVPLVGRLDEAGRQAIGKLTVNCDKSE